MATLTPPASGLHLPPDPLRQALAEGSRRAHTHRSPVLVSVTTPLDRLDPLAVFAAGMGLDAVPLYWEGRSPEGGPLALAGVGAAHTLVAEGPACFTTVASSWRALLDHTVIEGPNLTGAGPLLMGGAAFDPLRPRTATWQGFPDALFVLPRFTVRQDQAGVALTSNVLVHPGDDGEALAEATLRACAELLAAGNHWMDQPLLHADWQTAQPDLLEDLSSALEWQDVVARTAREIRERRFAKVVLARQARLRLGPSSPANRDRWPLLQDQEAEVDAELATTGTPPVGVRRGTAIRPPPQGGFGGPASIGLRAVQALARLRRGYPGSFLFAVSRPATGDAGAAIFLGASPERLIGLHAGVVEASCLAGSIRRGSTETEDAQLGQALLDSAKDLAEHAVVAGMLREALGPVCTDLQMPAEPGLLRLANVQHLHTPIRGTLAQPRCVLELVEQLHPTPAVGGYPRREALSAIREREALDRGWYAAPVGWLDRHGEGEIAVAIRSALIRALPPTRTQPAQAEALLFAGCGIMGDSDPATEYQESRLKMRVMLGALRD